MCRQVPVEFELTFKNRASYI